MMRLLGCLCVFVLLTGIAYAESGVRGRVAWRGELVPDVVVKAFQQVADIAAGQVVATSAPTGLDGIYQLDLPPGNYVLTASNAAAELKPGDMFCYYSGSPIRVPDTGYRNVGFNMIKVPREEPAQESKRSGIYGELTYQGEPLEKAYLYVYKDPGRNFKGPGYYIQPVAKGSFRLNLPPGEYYLLARKRVKGGQYGPIEIGDFFNYYHGNPVRIEKGKVRQVRIEAVTRLSMLEEDVVDFQGVRGLVVDKSGAPQTGMYVFAYLDPDMTGTPDFFSSPTADDGRFELSLPDGGPYYLLAREAFGGPAGGQELYGRKLGSVNIEGTTKEVTIHVSEKDTD